MPVPVISAALTPAQKTALDGAFQTIIDTLNAVAVVNLTPEERQSIPNIDNVRMPFVARTYELHVVNFPQFIPPFENLVESKKDIDLGWDLEMYCAKAAQVFEMTRDIQHVAYSEAWNFFLKYYNLAQSGAKSNVPGADSVVNDLKPLFDLPNNPPPPNP